MNPSERLNAVGLPIDFESEYVRQGQEDDNSCLFAVIAMVAGCTAHEVRAVAVANDHIPEHGPYNVVDDGSLAAFLAAHHQWVASVWKECSATYQIKSDVAILLIDVTENFPGRHVLFARQRNRGGKPNVEYIIDPGYWVEPHRHIRAISDHELSWYIALHPMEQSSDY
jgi:hypothetical protein